MQDTILTICCLCDDLLQALDYTDDPQTKLSTAEVMLVPLVAARDYGGKIEQNQSCAAHNFHAALAPREACSNVALKPALQAGSQPLLG